MMEWNEIHNYENDSRTREKVLIGKEEFKCFVHIVYRHKCWKLAFRREYVTTDRI